LGVAREVHPAELLDRGEPGRELIGGRIARGRAEREPVLQRIEPVPVGLLVLDGEADEVVWRCFALPVHGEQQHPVPTLELQRERRRIICANGLEIIAHDGAPRVDATVSASVVYPVAISLTRSGLVRYSQLHATAAVQP